MTEEHNHSQEVLSKTVFGFWYFLMTDCILFATFFAAYAVLHNGTFGGPSAKDLFHISSAFIETLIIFACSFTVGPLEIAAVKHGKKRVIAWLMAALVLGAIFLVLVFGDLAGLVMSGNSWTESAFLSSYFTLISTHLMHIVAGLIWILVMLMQVHFRGITEHTLRRLTCLKLFWHFVGIVWIFIFAIVYLLGAI